MVSAWSLWLGGNEALDHIGRDLLSGHLHDRCRSHLIDPSFADRFCGFLDVPVKDTALFSDFAADTLGPDNLKVLREQADVFYSIYHLPRTSVVDLMRRGHFRNK